MDLEAAGGAMTGGLIASAVEKPTGEAGEHHGVCSDCEAPVSGRFCANCGQPTHVHRSLLHLGEELLHGVMHFDARIWRTLPLLFINPGRLTREWVQGRRTRYVSPLAMFLFTLFVMFFALSFMPPPGATVTPLAERVTEQRADLAQAEQAVTVARNEMTAAGVVGSDAVPSGAHQDATAGALALAEGAVVRQRERLSRLEHEQTSGRSDGLAPGSWQAEVADVARDAAEQDKGHGMTATVLKKLKNPDLAVYKLQQTMYKFAFLLVPLSIPFVALMFLWKRGFTLYDHGVFVLYSLTFMSMLLMAIVVAATMFRGVGGYVMGAASFIAPIHMFAQLKGAYSLSIFSSLWRTFALLMFCNLAATLFIAAIVYLGLGH